MVGGAAFDFVFVSCPVECFLVFVFFVLRYKWTPGVKTLENDFTSDTKRYRGFLHESVLDPQPCPKGGAGH